MDPVTEVFLYQEKNRVRKRIKARTQQVLLQNARRAKAKNNAADDRMNVEEAAPPISLLTEDEDNDSDSSEATMDYVDDIVPDGQVPVAVQVGYEHAVPYAAKTPSKAAPSNLIPDPIVPKTIELEWERISEMNFHDLAPPQCKCNKCPYGSGGAGLMRQRYNLLVRLMVLERQLYGK